VAITNKDEWFFFMQKSIKSLEEEIGKRPWSDSL
jgi:hypothetical protein